MGCLSSARFSRKTQSHYGQRRHFELVMGVPGHPSGPAEGVPGEPRRSRRTGDIRGSEPSYGPYSIHPTGRRRTVALHLGARSGLRGICRFLGLFMLLSGAKSLSAAKKRPPEQMGAMGNPASPSNCYLSSTEQASARLADIVCGRSADISENEQEVDNHSAGAHLRMPSMAVSISYAGKLSLT